MHSAGYIYIRLSFKQKGTADPLAEEEMINLFFGTYIIVSLGMSILISGITGLNTPLLLTMHTPYLFAAMMFILVKSRLGLPSGRVVRPGLLLCSFQIIVTGRRKKEHAL